ncbi:modification methylase HemK [Plesiocystis pacifica SIR-1]|uniref:Modification methylase HemK n=1 Tax=Plesiocystis pacifica SIR-1 TaxID=391625 RepID=A6G0Z3_9BACT|nr:methyltransferase [Plesiocystis pacifica]EDM80531.1 modification methylase HemK [Plesiocystis pacifica SIR-1]
MSHDPSRSQPQEPNSSARKPSPAELGFDAGLDDRFRVYCETYSAEPTVATVAGVELELHPRVFRAAGASTTLTLLEALGEPEGLRVLDMGCGSGAVGVIAALRGAASVHLADLSPDAVANARANVRRHGLEDRCEVRCSDLFAAFSDERFDLIVFNVPFLYAAENEATTALPIPAHLEGRLPPAQAFIDVEYRLIRAFISQAKTYLAPGGVIRCTFANFGNHAVFDAIVEANGLSRTTVARRPEPEYGLEYLAYELRPV